MPYASALQIRINRAEHILKNVIALQEKSKKILGGKK
jgi:hypothetical protein